MVRAGINMQNGLLNPGRVEVLGQDLARKMFFQDFVIWGLPFWI